MKLPGPMSALRHRNFAIFWGAAAISDIGTWMQLIAVGVLVARITGKASATGLVGIAGFATTGLLAPIGGVLSDRFDRRKMMLGALGAQTIRMAYFYEGSSVVVGGTKLSANTGARVRCDVETELRAGDDGASILILQGTPIAEPVAQHGPFVMNTRAEIAQAFEDYQRTRFGGWPWPAGDPNHGADPARFAVYPNGSEERPLAVG